MYIHIYLIIPFQLLAYKSTQATNKINGFGQFVQGHGNSFIILQVNCEEQINNIKSFQDIIFPQNCQIFVAGVQCIDTFVSCN